MTRSRILVGLLLTVAGVILLLDRVGGLHKAADLLEQWWPLTIVFVGAANLLRTVQRPWSFWVPVIVMGVGAVLLLVTIEPPPRVATEAAGFFLPSLLVVVGLALALFEIGRERTEPQFLQKSAILRERRFSTSAKSLRHGRARAFLGHLELDLREARFRNDEADLDVTAVCGRVDVLIPRGYEVKLKPPVGLAVRAIEPPSAGANDDDGDDVEAGHLTVHVLAFFGCAEFRQP
jgi:4-amino-4-deoxy-L-arabinose transferase-like glycosyltransferase